MQKACSKGDAEKAVRYAEEKLQRTFHEKQKSAILAFLTGNDIFVSLPTGYGKSLIFQAIPVCYDYIRAQSSSSSDLAASAMPSIAVVVSPLVSLCKDQVQTLAEMGIKAIYLGDVKEEDWKDVEGGLYSVVYGSPEMLLDDKGSVLLMSDVYTDRLCGLFVDEAHCIAKWGFSSKTTEAFREQYSRLAELRSLVSSTVRMGVFTATASSEMRGLICENLALHNLAVFSEVPNRPNIRYSVLKATTSDLSENFDWLLTKLQQERQNSPRVIVYCQRLTDCAELYGIFESGMKDRDNGTDPEKRLYAMYHSQTSDDLKQHIGQSFTQEDGIVRVLFATIAFGMGIDAKGLETIIHYGSSQGTDDYLQETGRAGRQGEESVAVLLHHPKAFVIRRPTEHMKAYIATAECRRKQLLQHFTVSDDQANPTELYPPTYTCCDVCHKDSPSWVEVAIKEGVAKPQVTRVVTDSDKAELKTRLLSYRETLISELPREGLLAGPDLATGFPVTFITRIIEGTESVLPFEEFWNTHPFVHKVQAREVFDIVEEVVGECCQVEILHVKDCDFSEEFEESDNSESEYGEIHLDESSDDNDEW